MENLIEKRAKIETELSNILNSSYRKMNFKDKEEEERNFTKIENAIAYFDELLSTTDVKDLEQLLSGEFERQTGLLGYSSDGKAPAYLYIDLAIALIRKEFLVYDDIKERASSIINKLEILKTNLIRYDFNKMFDPTKSFNERVLDNMIASKGNFKFAVVNDNGKRYAGVDAVITIEHVTIKNGDYYSDGPATHSFLDDELLFEEDRLKVEQDRLNAKKAAYERLLKVAGKYFTDGQIPFSYDFYRMLETDVMNEEIKTILYSISMAVDRNQYGLYDIAFDSLSKLDEIEIIEALELEIKQEKEQKEKRVRAIDEARRRYNSKNFFWKFVNRKVKPEIVVTDDMDINQINNLYR